MTLRTPVGFGSHRLPRATILSGVRDPFAHDQRSREMLCRVLTLRTCIAFIGSGCSVSLGYPTWRDLTQKLLRKVREIKENERLARYQKALDTNSYKTEDLPLFVAACQNLLRSAGQEHHYENFFFTTFQPPSTSWKDSCNPYKELLDLPLHRFVTSNYDCEMERALYFVRRIQFPELARYVGTSTPSKVLRDHYPGSVGGTSRQGEPARSFTQKPEYYDRLALFSLARVVEARDMVFHCHGRFDDPDSIIATEADYQQWYLSSEESAESFRQTIDLLFASNPIFFVGFGMADADLMHSLRLLGAVNPEKKPFRPLFALVPSQDPDGDWDRREFLYERYGLNTLTYQKTNEPDQGLCSALRSLKDEWLEWRNSWLKKPPIRKVVVQAAKGQPYRHYGLERNKDTQIGEKQVSVTVGHLADRIKDGEHILAIVGPGGTGKSWHALALLEKLFKEKRLRGALFNGLFFWSSYYADDALTGLDRLLAYVDPGGDTKAPRFSRLKASLNGKRFVVVLDGFERLMTPSNWKQEGADPEIGEFANPVVKSFVELFSDTNCHSHLVLTSRLRPRTLTREQVFRLECFTPEAIQGDALFKQLGERDVGALCSLLGGHAYALVLAGLYLKGLGYAQSSISQLRQALVDTPADRRVSRMIREVIEAMQRKSHGLALMMLERIAIFMSPITEEVLAICYNSAKSAEQDSNLFPSCMEVTELLLSSGLLFRVSSGQGGSDRPALTVHPLVRSFVFEQIHEVERDAMPNFGLPGFTSGDAAVYPGSQKSAAILTDVFERLHAAAGEELRKDQQTQARDLCHSLFAVVRSRMESNTTPRWCSYLKYIRYGLIVMDLARQVSEKYLWNFDERFHSEIEREDAPLYADELAWLYNDIGLTLCAEGNMPDTYAVWEQGYEVNRIIDDNALFPRYRMQSQLHLAHTCLELGQLPLADQYLDQTEITNKKVCDDDYGSRITGYRALLAHLRANFEEADDLYHRAINNLKLKNSRAESYFLRHWAMLAIRRGQPELARERALQSWARAEDGRHPDLVAYARTAQARVLCAEGTLEKATPHFHAALTRARELGIARLESEILCELARLALVLGDSAIARQRAMNSLCIANELGLGLRQTQSLLVLGLATIKSGQVGLGIAYVKHARALAIRQEFWLRSREAEEQLQALGETT